MLNCVSVYDHETDALDTFRYPDTSIPEEHLFVPQPGSAPESEGWVVGTALDYRSQSTELNVFAAERIAQGPIATARLPYALPIGLHGKFV